MFSRSSSDRGYPVGKMLSDPKRRRGSGYPYGDGSVWGPVSECGGGSESSVPRSRSNVNPFFFWFWEK